MEIDESNPDDFPDLNRAVEKRFFIRMASGVHFMRIFKSLSLSSSSLLLIVCDEGDKVTFLSEYQKCIQGACSVSKSMFDEAILPVSLFKFAISSQDIQEAIAMMPDASVELSCIDEGDPLNVRMTSEAGDILVETIIQVFEHDHILDFGFDRTTKLTRLVLDSHVVRTSLEHFDLIGLETELSISTKTPKFVIRSEGVVGHVQIEFNDQLLDKEAPFRCQRPVSHMYQTAFIKNILKACQYSTHVSFRIDQAGVLQVQHLLLLNITGDKAENLFLTFFVNPNFDDESQQFEPVSVTTSSSSLTA